MRILTALLLLSTLSACSVLSPPTEFVPPVGAPARGPTSEPLILPEVQATLILESRITRTPPSTPGPGQQYTPQVSALPPLEAELVAHLLSVEYLSEKTLARVQIFPPASLFAPQTSIFLLDAYVESSQGQIYAPLQSNNLSSGLIELEFPPLDAVQGEIVLHLVPEISDVPASQALQVDLRGKTPGTAWPTSQTLTFGGARVEVTRMLLLESTPSGQNGNILSLEIQATGGWMDGWQSICLTLALPEGVFQGSGSCAATDEGLVSAVELGIPAGEDHPLLTAPFELGVSASFEATRPITLTWKR